MIGQYLSNNNETVTVAFRQKNCQLNSLLSPKHMGLSTDWSKKELDECYRCWLGGLDSQAQALSVWSLKLEDPRIMVHHACRCKLQSYYRAPLTTTCSYQSAEGTTSHADLYHLITPKCMCFPRLCVQLNMHAHARAGLDAIFFAKWVL
jgi:hypothetical protein